jgi:hypothetical protein
MGALKRIVFSYNYTFPLENMSLERAVDIFPFPTCVEKLKVCPLFGSLSYFSFSLAWIELLTPQFAVSQPRRPQSKTLHAAYFFKFTVCTVILEQMHNWRLIKKGSTPQS